MRKDVGDNITKDNKPGIFSKIAGFFKIEWWTQQYTGERAMRESRVLLLLLAIMYSISGISAYLGAKTEGVRYGGIGILIFSGLCLLASILKSFWFRFICLALWVIDLFISLFFFQGGFNPLRILYLVIGLVFIYKMWRLRKQRIVQPPFKFSDFLGGNKIDLNILLKIFGISILLATLVGLFVLVFR